MSSRRQRSIPFGGRYRQVSLYLLLSDSTNGDTNGSFYDHFEGTAVTAGTPTTARTTLEFTGHADHFLFRKKEYGVTTEKCYPHHWPFVRRTQRSQVEFPWSGPVMPNFVMFSFMLVWKGCLSNSRVASDLRSITLMWYNCHECFIFKVLKSSYIASIGR